MGSPHSHPRGFGVSGHATVWEIGLVSLPATVPGADGHRYRPLVALVVDASGAVRAMAPGHPDRPQEALEEAITHSRLHPQPPCQPGEPRRVVVDSSRLQKLVPALLPGVLVSRGETPRLAEVASSLREHMAGEEGQRGLASSTTYCSEDVTPEVVRTFFEGAAALYDRRPWRRFPSDGHLFQLTCGPLGIRGWTGCVIGQHQESYGVLLFDSVGDYGSYVEAAERAEAGDEQAMALFPKHRAINFEAKSAMPKGLLREIQLHGWPVAGPEAYPTVMLVEPDLLLLPPRQTDVRRLELVALTLCAWLDAEPDLACQWDQDQPPRKRRFRIEVGGMTVPVQIGAVHPPGERGRDFHSQGDATQTRAPANKPAPKVPAALRERVDSLMARLDPFCTSHLNSDYRELLYAALAALARKRPSPLLSGRESSWCAGVVQAIGTANFLFDPSQTPHCPAKTICEAFGVSASTAHAHAKKVRELLGIHPFAPHWSLPSVLEQSAIPWMLEVNGFIQDVRDLPLEIQVEACAKGLIPYVPALRDHGPGPG
jgi:hypothetical protein